MHDEGGQIIVCPPQLLWAVGDLCEFGALKLCVCHYITGPAQLHAIKHQLCLWAAFWWERRSRHRHHGLEGFGRPPSLFAQLGFMGSIFIVQCLDLCGRERWPAAGDDVVAPSLLFQVDREAFASVEVLATGLAGVTCGIVSDFLFIAVFSGGVHG